MKRLIFTAGALALLAWTAHAIAEVQPNAEAAKTIEVAKEAAKKSGKQTDMKFDELLVQGKYHFTDEAVVTVEEDKVLDALLGTRTHFQDRIKKSAARH